MTTLPRILLAHRVLGDSIFETHKQSIKSHAALKKSIKRADLKLVCDSMYDYVNDAAVFFSLQDVIGAANEDYSHIILDAQDANDQNLFPAILRKYDSGFIVLNPLGAPMEYLRQTGADFSVTDNHLRGDGSAIPFEDQLATALDLITKRITNGYFMNDKILCARKGRFSVHRYTKQYSLAQGRSFSWLK